MRPYVYLPVRTCTYIYIPHFRWRARDVTEIRFGSTRIIATREKKTDYPRVFEHYFRDYSRIREKCVGCICTHVVYIYIYVCMRLYAERILAHLYTYNAHERAGRVRM